MNILQLDWPEIRKLSLSDAHEIREQAKEMAISLQEKCELDDVLGIDCRRMKSKKHHTQNLLGKINSHIKSLNKAETFTSHKLRKILKEERQAKDLLIAEIKELKLKIKELESAQ